MAEHSHPDLERSIGRIEGSIDGLGKSLDALRTQTTSGFRDLKQDLHEIHTKERKQNGQIGNLKSSNIALKEWIGGGLAMAAFLIWLGFQIWVVS